MVLLKAIPAVNGSNLGYFYVYIRKGCSVLLLVIDSMWVSFGLLGASFVSVCGSHLRGSKSLTDIIV